MWRYLAFRKLGSVVVETFLLVGCYCDAYYLRLNQSPLELPDRYTNLSKALLIALVFQLFLHLNDVYDFRSRRSLKAYAIRLAQALILASAVLWTLYYIFPALTVGRGVFGISLVLSSVFLVIWHTILRLYSGVRTPRSNVIVLGTGRLAKDLVREILKRPELGMKVKGFVDDNPELVGVSIVNPKVIGLYQDLPLLIHNNAIDRVVVELQDRRGRLPIKDLLDCKTRGIAVEDATTLYERVTGKIAIENLKPSWMIFNSGFDVSKQLLIQKRVLSIAVSSIMLLVLWPLILIIMLAIKLNSKGPVFFKQERVGQDGKVFKVWKFRSMCVDAEKETGPVWSDGVDDVRVTRVGRILRRMRLDELPQLWNVLKGDMSLVGPRPERPHFVEQLAKAIPYYQLRHVVKPGVTGWAQINYKYASTIEHTAEKLQYDLFYIKNMSWLLDALIIFETIKTVLVRRGS